MTKDKKLTSTQLMSHVQRFREGSYFKLKGKNEDRIRNESMENTYSTP